MTTNTIDLNEISGDHNRWETDHANWLRDVHRWQKTHGLALNELKHLEAIIAEYADVVRHHAETIVAHEKTLVHHAGVMREKPSDDDLVDFMAACHRRAAATHAQTNDVHVRLKERLADVMHQLRVLSRTAEQKI